MALHVFVAMPFGTKKGVDFNKVYTVYLKPALEGEGFEVFRADEERSAGNIRTDMFQELLLADLVVADLSIDNPNVWYELGVRHALRARGVIQIQCRRDYQPFDVYTDRKLRYHVKAGVPDPEFLEADKETLAVMARETMAAWHGKKISPVFYHLSYLQEPDWKKLVVGGAKEFWQKHKSWETRVDVARKKNRPGDLLVLAEEAPVQALRLEAYRKAGNALHEIGQVEFALEQFEKALAIDPTDLQCRQKKGILLGRKDWHEDKIVWLQNLVDEYPDDSDTLALLGRVKKEAWVQAWRKEGATVEALRSEAAVWENLLEEAIQTYEEGFLKNPSHYFSGINAVALHHLFIHLTGDAKYGERLRAMEGAVRWAVQSALSRERLDQKDYWARVTLGDLEVLIGQTPVIEKAYRDAVIAADGNWFALDSSHQQLTLLRDLGFRPGPVASALEIFAKAMDKLKAPWQPRKVFLFSGHMIDAPDRAEPRFPPDKEFLAAQAIAATLDELGAGPEDLALCGGACGGDLLFAEACLKRGLHLQIRIPFEVPTFFQKSVTFADEKWKGRFYVVKDQPNTNLLVMPEELGALPLKVNPYERNNLWQLYTALSWGPEKVEFIGLWNRKGGDGPGGTKHMHDEVKKRSGKVHVLDTNILW